MCNRVDRFWHICQNCMAISGMMLKSLAKENEHSHSTLSITICIPNFPIHLLCTANACCQIRFNGQEKDLMKERAID